MNMNSTEFYEVMRKKRPFGWELAATPAVQSFQFEQADPFYWRDFIARHQAAAFYAGGVYILLIFTLERWMRSRPAFDLRTPLFLWNLSLGLLSLFSLARSLPGFLQALSQPNGLYNTLCLKKDMDVPSAFWGLIFAFSKFVELGDTLFIILRKRPLIFLQWYHHLATLTVVWILAPLVEPIARWYAIWNGIVHCLMYPYFAIRTVGVKMPAYVPNVITTLQLTQMVIGFGVNMTSLYLQKVGRDCVRYPISIKAFAVVYGSFLLLFGKLFYDAVIKGGRKRREKNKKLS